MVVARKLLSLIPVMLAVSALTFLLTALLPGDPVDQIVGPDSTPAVRAAARSDLGLDKPLPVRYVKWLGGVATGDLGRSYKNNQKVVDIITQRLPITLELMVLAQLMALGVAIPLAIWSAYRKGGVADRVTTGFSFALLSVPNFMLAVVLVLLFAVKAHLFPAIGFVHLSDSLSGNLKSVFLPSLTLAVGLLAVYVRLLRSDMIATLQEDYILMARAQGVPPMRVLFRHALRPSSFSLLTVAGINVGALIGGAVIVEFIFAMSGMGSLIVESIGRRDYLVVQGVVLLVAAAYVLINFCVDLLYTFLDPRIRHA